MDSSVIKMYIHRVPPKVEDVILKDGVVDKLELTWEKYDISDLTEVKVMIPVKGVKKSPTTFTYPEDRDSAYPFVPTPVMDIEEGTTNVEKVVAYRVDSATPLDTYTVIVDYTASDFQADDIDLTITETQLFDIVDKSTITYETGGIAEGTNTETFAGDAQAWGGAYLTMVTAHEATPEFVNWSRVE